MIGVAYIMYASSCSFLFHVVASLHPPSFHRNDISTCIPTFGPHSVSMLPSDNLTCDLIRS